METFTRSQEAEADYLGAQYMYKAGYDPSALLSFFEKLQAKEKSKPGTMSTLFTDHPPTAARIAAIKHDETILPNRDQYVMSTSEFGTVKARLMSLENRQSVATGTRPTFKRKSPNSRPTDSDPAAAGENDPSPATQTDDSPSADDRPTLKRKN